LFEKMIETAVEKALDRRTVRPERKLSLEGYHPLPEIMGALYEWLMIPFRDTEILVEVRYPRSTQLPDVDKLYAIINQQKNEKKLTRQNMIDYLNIQEQCCKAVLNRPTFEELEEAIYGKDCVLRQNRELIKELEAKIKEIDNETSRRELREQFDKVELFCGYILPDDTMAALMNIALGVDVSDIRKLTKEKLVAAYSKARLYGGKPSDFITGIFTDGDRQNIDDYATVVGGEDEMQRRKKK